MSRTAWVLTGVALVIWLAFEDRSLAAVQLLGAAIVVSVLLTFRARRRAPNGWIGWIAAGGGAGALVGGVAALLIFVKTGAHAHPQPDFSMSDIMIVLGRTPIWILVGGLAGAAGFLLERARGQAASTDEPTRYNDSR